MTTDPIARDTLIAAAAESMRQAYAPYSGFRVGAAIQGANNVIFRGCNVENSSYGLSLCAERGALSRALAEGCRQFRALAVVASDTRDSERPAACAIVPCGACLQVLAEFCEPDMPVFCASAHNTGDVCMRLLNELLPCAFRIAHRRQAHVDSDANDSRSKGTA